jgi:hypothetical protein
MDWFEQLTGFREEAYEATRARLEVVGRTLRSKVNGREFGIGELTLPSLQMLRDQTAPMERLPGRLKVSEIIGDARRLHGQPEFRGALFQVASQFNCLEMTDPSVTPGHGVTRYQRDGTQGPACAIAAGAATIYRNYFAPLEDGIGQTAARQLDTLADLGRALSERCGVPVSEFWTMRNGYALCRTEGLRRIAAVLAAADNQERARLAGLLRIGLHSGVQVTDGSPPPDQQVSQAFCSALPVSYAAHVPAPLWEPLARLVLEGAYEATLLAGVLNAAAGHSNIVLLTRIGGGAFGNTGAWIDDAIDLALEQADGFDVDVRTVARG